METRLKIIWDGEAPGLAQHRLSLSEFGPALGRMLIALRRIASGIVTQAQEDGDAGLRGGRLAKLASQLDLEITGVEPGSLGLAMACVLRLAPEQNADQVRSLADQTCSEFVSAIEQESAGHPRHGMVREYLRALPAGVHSQRYTVQLSDGSVRSVEVGEMALAQMPTDAPSLDEVAANIIGVGFDPGRPEVRLLDPKTKRTYICSATQSLVDSAISLRAAPVHALMVLNAGKLRLLRLWAADGNPELPTEMRSALLWDRWDELLRRFAQ